MIGDDKTNNLTKSWLCELMNSLGWKNKGKGRIIELMAGSGRNFDCYSELFEEFEMLDGSSKLLKLAPKKVLREKNYLQRFRW